MNTCVVCGEIIPEGRQVCYRCEREPMVSGYIKILPEKGEHMDFEELKQIVLNSIDESANMIELIQTVIDKVYQKGFIDGRTNK